MDFGIGQLGFIAVLMQFVLTPGGEFDLKFTPVGPFPDYESCMVFKKMKDKELRLNNDGFGVFKDSKGTVLFLKSVCRVNRFANDERKG